MPLPDPFKAEQIAEVYPDNLVNVICKNKSGTLLGGHWGIWPSSSSDYFVKCSCGCADNMYTVYGFEDHCGRHASRKWKDTIRVADGSNITLGQWIEDRCSAADGGLPVEGSRVSVYWPGENDWFSGTVKVVDRHGRSFVSYDDGQVEILHFAMERFKLLDKTPASVLPDEDTVIDLCSGNSDLDDVPQQLVLTSGTPRSSPFHSRASQAGCAADSQQLATREQPSSTDNAKQCTIQGEGRVRSPIQTDGHSQRRRKSKAPVKTHRRAPEPSTVGLARSQQDVTEQRTAEPQAAHSSPHAQPPATPVAGPCAHSTLRREKPAHGPRLPDRSRHLKRSLKQARSDPLHTAQAEVPQPTTPEQATAPAVTSTDTKDSQPPAAKRVKFEEDAGLPHTPVTATNSAPQSHPGQAAHPASLTQPHPPAPNVQLAAEPPSRQPIASVRVASFAQLGGQHNSVVVDRQQTLLDQFGAGAQLDLQGKTAALQDLVESVVDSMTYGKFLASIDRNETEATGKISRYYQRVSVLVQDGGPQVNDKLLGYFGGLVS